MFHSDRLQKMLKISNFFPSFQNFIINRENLIKIGRAGGKTSNREGWSLCRLIKIPKIMAKSGGKSLTQPLLLSKMKPDHSLPIHCPFFVEAFFFFHFGLEDENRHERLF